MVSLQSPLGGEAVAEVLVQFSTTIPGEDGRRYAARACGGEMADGRWQGWIEFLPADPGEPLRTGRETTQPDREATVYWATGLTPVYLEGALARAERSTPPGAEAPPPSPLFDGPAGTDSRPRARAEAVLDPFSVYRNGEAVLRRQLGALSSWHLVNIIDAHGLSDLDQAALDRMTQPELIELIVAEVLRRVESAAR